MPLEYTGQVVSAAINGEVKLSFEDNGLTMTALFEAYHVPYIEHRGELFLYPPWARYQVFYRVP